MAVISMCFMCMILFMVNTGETKINDTYLLASKALGKISGRGLKSNLHKHYLSIITVWIISFSLGI